MKIKPYLIELSLVVIGILIALSVDNIRDDIRGTNSVKSLLQVMKEDLKFDIDTLRTQLKQDSFAIKKYSKVLSLLEQKKYDSIDWHMGYLYYNSEYEIRSTGYKMLTTSNLLMRVDINLLKEITTYYETTVSDLNSWSKKDDSFALKMVDFLMKNHDNFQNSIKERPATINELRRLVIGKEFLLVNEMSRKQKIIKRAKKLREQLS